MFSNAIRLFVLDGFEIKLSLPSGEIDMEDMGAMLVEMWGKPAKTQPLPRPQKNGASGPW